MGDAGNAPPWWVAEAERWAEATASRRIELLLAVGKASARAVREHQPNIDALLRAAAADERSAPLGAALASLGTEGGAPSWREASVVLGSVMKLYAQKRSENPPLCAEGALASIEWNIEQGFSLEAVIRDCQPHPVSSEQLPFRVRDSAREALKAAYTLPTSARSKPLPPLPSLSASSTARAPSAHRENKDAQVRIALPKSSRQTMQLGRSSTKNGMGIEQRAPRMMIIDGAESEALQRSRLPQKKETKRKSTVVVERDPFAGAIQAQADGSVVYFQDRRKQWPFQTSALGHKMLLKLLEVATPLMRQALTALAEEEDGGALRREGERIYAQKPNMRAGGITWSQENYAHLGLQAEYMRLKSIQRFTEGTAAMERAFNMGAFRNELDAPPGCGQPFRVASLGGGPGFELVAVREFCASHLPHVEPDLLSLDLQGAWRPCAESLGLRFDVWDVNDGDGLLAKTGGWESIDLAVISYVYYHYMSNEHCAEWLARLINSGAIRAVLIISRFEDLTPNVNAVERRGVRVIHLMRQPRNSRRSTDHRQMLYVSASEPEHVPMPSARRLPCTFPNVPHEDQKAPTDKSFREVPGGYEYTNDYVLPPPPPPSRPSAQEQTMFAPPPLLAVQQSMYPRRSPPSPRPESFGNRSPQPASLAPASPDPFTMDSFDQPLPENADHDRYAYAASSDEETAQPRAASATNRAAQQGDAYAASSDDEMRTSAATSGAKLAGAYAASFDDGARQPPAASETQQSDRQGDAYAASSDDDTGQPAAPTAALRGDAYAASSDEEPGRSRAPDAAWQADAHIAYSDEPSHAPAWDIGSASNTMQRVAGGDLFDDADPLYGAATPLPVWAPPGAPGGELVLRKRSVDEMSRVAAQLREAGIIGMAASSKKPRLEEHEGSTMQQHAMCSMACNFVRATEPGSLAGGCTSASSNGIGSSTGPSIGSGGTGMSAQAEAIMRKMGWSEGTGLGIAEQGISRPIEEKGNLGSFGLGFRAAGITDDDAPVAEPLGEDEIAVLPVVNWLETLALPRPSMDEMRQWVVEGARKASIDEETDHTDSEVLRGMLVAKTALDALTDRRAFDDARARANPFEGIKKEFFLNRAALKMAAIDAALEGLFSCADAPQPAVAFEQMVGWHYRAAAEAPQLGYVPSGGQPPPPRPPKPAPGLLFFGDVAAGPGGFSEYVLWRRGGSAKGFGFTLRGDHDFTPGRFHGAAPPELFHPYYGPNNDGDLYSSENLRALRALVMRQTDGYGLHMMMADGGFDVSGKENIQELMNKQLLLGQFAAAVGTLREGGHFVCKAFDLFTPFSAGLLYLMGAHFSSIALYKPAQSRPANSERYVICRGLRGDGAGASLFQHLLTINDRINELKPSWGPSSLDINGTDVLELVPREVIQGSSLGGYLRESNDRIGRLQRRALRRLVAYMREKGSRSCDQSATRDDCLAAWRIPDTPPPPPRRSTPDEAYALDVECGEQLPRVVQPQSLMRVMLRPPSAPKSHFVVPADWVVMPSASDMPPALIFGADVGNVRGVAFVWAGRGWEPIIGVRLPRATLLIAEKVTEKIGTSLRDAVHVYDAAVLAGDDVRKLPYAERRRRLALLVDALQRDSEVIRQSVVGVGGSRGYGKMGYGGVEDFDELSAGDTAVAQTMPIRLKTQYSLKEVPLALVEADHRARQGYDGICWPFRGMLLFPGHAIPSTQAPGPGWNRYTSRRTGEDYWASPQHPGKSIPIVRKPISFRGCLQALMRWDPKTSDVSLDELRSFGEELAAL